MSTDERKQPIADDGAAVLKSAATVEDSRGQVFRGIIRTVVLYVCLAQMAPGLHAGALRMSGWHGVHPVSLLIAACFCLGALEVRVRRRYSGKTEQMAESLASGLRSGVLEFSGTDGVRTLASLRWDEPDEPEEPAESECKALQIMPSRYRLLGYNRSHFTVEPEPLPYVTRVIGQETVTVDKELLLGMRREMLNAAVNAPLGSTQ